MCIAPDDQCGCGLTRLKSGSSGVRASIGIRVALDVVELEIERLPVLRELEKGTPGQDARGGPRVRGTERRCGISDRRSPPPVFTSKSAGSQATQSCGGEVGCSAPVTPPSLAVPPVGQEEGERRSVPGPRVPSPTSKRPCRERARDAPPRR